MQITKIPIPLSYFFIVLTGALLNMLGNNFSKHKPLSLHEYWVNILAFLMLSVPFVVFHLYSKSSKKEL